ncbi:lectin-like domain-containing protein, partial [Staphylococcus haemolyticus]|uniref:lectin-like domain-containing protein n=1 Tax=Staphylococcus haemolyticus TaxID=1283 RepID=UPI001C1F3BE9
MSRKERNFKRSFGQEKARVKLYKSGKQWVKAGIREVQLLKVLGLPFLNKDVEQINNLDTNKDKNFKNQAMKATGLAGGAFTFAMLNDHHAYAASETPMTSEIASNSETVANQNSTTVTNSETSTTESISSQTSTSQDATSSTNSTEKSTSSSTTDSQTSTDSTSDKSTSNSEKQDSSMSNSDTKASSSSTTDNSTSNNSATSEKDTNSQANTTSIDSQKGSTSTSDNSITSTSTKDNKIRKNSIESNSITSSNSTLLVSDSTNTSTSTAPLSLRTFSKYAVNTLAIPTTVTTYVASAPTTDVVTVTKDNFSQHFNLKDTAIYDANTGIVTLTSDTPSQKGSITLNTKINSNKSFNFTGKVNLGNRYEGYSPDGVIGGDGIGFAFSPGTLDATGKEGAAVGIGGLTNAFGFKLDTYHNTSTPKSISKAYADPRNVGGGGAFGAFVSTNSSGMATTEATGAAKLNVQPNSNTFQDFVIDYNGDTKVMTVNYAGQTFTRNLSDWLRRNSSPNYALSITASTGSAQNLQQIQFGTFTYTQTAVTQVNYVDITTGKQLIPFKTYAGDVDNVFTLDSQENLLNALGYKYAFTDSSNAPTFNATNNQVKLTNTGQSVTYYYQDIKAPTINMNNQINEVYSQINPIFVNVSDNSGETLSITVNGLPDGLTYDSQSNTITGIPTKIGSHTVNITATDSSNNSSTQSINWTVTRNETSDSISTSTSTTNSQSKLASENISTSESASASTSMSDANSLSTSKSKSISMSLSDVASTSTSLSGSTSTSVSDSASASTSLSGSTSTSESDSTSASTSESESSSTSVSDSASASTSLSGSTSTSLSDSASASTSLSGSTSTSESDSTSTSTSDSASTSTSVSDSTSASTSLSESTSTSVSDSTSASTSLSA